MQQKYLLLALAILGILLLLVLSEITTPLIFTSEKLNTLKPSDAGTQIKIAGTLDKISYNQKTISIYLKNIPQEIVIFENKIIQIPDCQNIEIDGKIDFYQNKSQIIANKITCSQN